MVKGTDFIVSLGSGNKATTEELLKLVNNAKKKRVINLDNLQSAQTTGNIERAFNEAEKRPITNVAESFPEIKVSPENYKQFAFRLKSLDPAAMRRFKTEVQPRELDAPLPSSQPTFVPQMHLPTKEAVVNKVISSLEKNPPKTKEEAFARLEHRIQELKKINVEVSEDMIQTLKNDIIKKFGD